MLAQLPFGPDGKKKNVRMVASVRATARGAFGNVGVAVSWCVKVGNFFSKKKKRKHFWAKMFLVFFFNFQFFSFQFLVSSKNKKQKKTPEVQGGFFPPFKKKKTHTHLKREASVWSRVYVRGRAGVWGCGRGGVLVPCAGQCI